MLKDEPFRREPAELSECETCKCAIHSRPLALLPSPVVRANGAGAGAEKRPRNKEASRRNLNGAEVLVYGARAGRNWASRSRRVESKEGK